MRSCQEDRLESRRGRRHPAGLVARDARSLPSIVPVVCPPGPPHKFKSIVLICGFSGLRGTPKPIARGSTISAKDLRDRMSKPCGCFARRRKQESGNSMTCYHSFLTDDTLFQKLHSYVNSWLDMDKLEQDQFDACSQRLPPLDMQLSKNPSSTAV